MGNDIECLAKIYIDNDMLLFR